VPDAPLQGLRILDVSTGIAGAYATKLLVDGGADAVVVEPPEGHRLRRHTSAATPLADGEDGVLFRYLRASTRSILADRERALALAPHVDVVVESYAPGEGHWGDLRPDRWLAANPRVAVVSVSPWGSDGPWADRPATEFTVQAACGATARRGLPERVPVSAGGAIVEWLTGAFAAVGAVTAWLHGRRSGVGQHVDVSMLEVATLCLNGPYHAIAGQWYPGFGPPRAVEVPSIESTAGGPVGFCTQTAQQWADFCVVIGRPDLADDATLRRADERSARRAEIEGAIAAAIGDLPLQEVIELGVALRVPVTPVGNGATVTGFDQLVARHVYERGPDGVTRPTPPYRVHGVERRPPAPAPRPAEHDRLAPDDLWPTGAAAAAPRSPTDRPLRGLRVVDLTAFWAGPFATTYLAAMGADVVKVESTARPDGIRFLGAFAGDAYWERSMVFAGANPGKRDLTIDLEDPAGRDVLWRLLDGADVLIENFTPRVADRFGLTWEALHGRWPALVMVRMPAFGLDGPWRDRAGFAMTIEQTSGLAWVTGYDDLPLVPRGPCDPMGGMHAALGLLAAVELRGRTGAGHLVEVPLVDGALNIAAEQVLEWERTGEVLTRHGNRGPWAHPQGIYRARGDDAWLAVAVETDSQWRGLVSVIGPPLGDREAPPDEMDAAISAWTADRDGERAAEALTAAGVPASPVVPTGTAHDNPQFAHRGFLQPLAHPVTGTTGYPGFPMRFSAFGPHLYASPPPLLGQHNHEVLTELGLAPAEIADLAARGVIGDRPRWEQ
jgi:crotonobetainyl-CoA:carnitine CoA-transferase CaiB-like acyl-CoA transferase